MLTERWLQFYNEQRPHGALRYLVPVAARSRALDEAINSNLTA